MLNSGFIAVGRPSCAGGIKLLLNLMKVRVPSAVVVISDRDVPGQRGAMSLASAFRSHGAKVKVVTPPAKDARAWMLSGATSADVRAVIDSTDWFRERVVIGPLRWHKWGAA